MCSVGHVADPSFGARLWLALCQYSLVADVSARTVSLTENVQRGAMRSADQFEVFAALVKEGWPIEDIEADFAVTLLVLQRRLTPANVSRPRCWRITASMR